MAGREEWLGLTREDALEPALPVCDPHHHLWEHPGSRYLLPEFLADLAGGHAVASTVYVECAQWYRPGGPEALRPVGETEFIERVASARGGEAPEVAAGIVGFADLALGAAVEPVLEAHLAASERFRGVRHATAWDPSPEIRPVHTHPPQGLLGDAGFRAGFARLAPLGLSFDAWLYHTQFDELASLARAFPGTAIVLDHMGGPPGIGPYAGRREETFAAWREALARLATCANVSVKLGGRTLTLAGYGWHRREAPPGSEELAAAMAPWFDACIGLFGPGRCMFEGDFPVERASCSYTVLWNAFKRACRPYAPAERAALLHDTAAQFYRIGRAAAGPRLA